MTIDSFDNVPIKYFSEERFQRIEITAYSTPFIVPKSDEDFVPNIRATINGCIFNRCNGCGEFLGSRCTGVTELSFFERPVPPRIRKPLDTSPDMVQVFVHGTAFNKRTFNKSNTPCLGGK
ncbi:MAG: hypothetical protein U0525_02045 [Patescibacteria group bacterium]